MKENTKSAYSEKMSEITDRLTEGVKSFQNSEQFKSYLRFMGKFPSYSFRNSLLIYQQNPSSELCASYTVWKKLGRHVKSGEKGMLILCPAFKKVDMEKTDKTGKPILDANGKPEKETVTLQKYVPRYTFDVSQTEGKEIPQLCTELKGEVENFQKYFKAVKATAGCPVEFEDIKGGAKGYYSPTDHRIAIKNGMDEAQVLKTALHECCHSKCECLENKNNPEYAADKAGRETRAEAVAYVVCSHFGLDTSDYSFSYLASWASQDTKELNQQMSMIQKTSNEIIESMEKHLGVEAYKFMTDAKEAVKADAQVKKATKHNKSVRSR